MRRVFFFGLVWKILDVDLDVDVVDVNVDVAQCNGWRVTSRRERDSIAW